MNEGIKKEDVELAERYANALNEIEIQASITTWNEDDVVMAERYAKALEEIYKFLREFKR